MNTTTINRESLESARQALEKHPAVDTAYVLGSAATGRLRPDSDIDIAILPKRGEGLPIMERLALSAALGKIFGRQVDLGVLTTSNLVYAKEAVAHGRLIFERDHGTTARFAMLALSMYAALQEARREVLRAYAA